MTALNIYISNLIKQGMYLVQLVLWGSLAVSAVLYVVSIFGDLFWISDMLHNFALHLLLFFVGFFLFSLLTAQRKLASMALIFVILQSYHIHRQLPQLLPFDIEAACTQCSGEEISLFQYNLLFSNPRVPQLVNWLLEDLEHDILVFQEATSTHQEALAPLSFAYPFVYHHKDISLFSRLPLEKAGHAKKGAFIELVGQTSQGQMPFHLFAVHNEAPRNEQAWQNRNQLLIGAAKKIANAPMQHKILVGDMNVTIYSRWFNKLLAISGLENNGTEQLLNPSWSPLTKRSFWAGLRIDHLLTTPSINVLAQTIGPDYGSDHLPIITRLQFSDETVKGE